MVVALQVVSVLLVAIAMSLAAAHALESPGKRRLDRQTYLAVQTIYYPGFTFAGAGEPLAAIATLILLITMRHQGAAYWWVLVSFIALLAMHAVFWLVTQPTNRYWLRHQQLGGAGARFFGMNRSEGAREDHQEEESESADWKALRNRWEYSHIIRSILALIALVTLTVAIAR